MAGPPEQVTSVKAFFRGRVQFRQSTSVDEAQQDCHLTLNGFSTSHHCFVMEEEEWLSDVVLPDFMMNGPRDFSCHPFPCV
jgi:hypothetical protein